MAVGRKRPLAGRTLLVIGAGSSLGQEVARLAAALGADVVVADADVTAAVRTAGLIAATGAVVRVVEVACPPAGGMAVVAAAREALRAPTDVVVVSSPSSDAHRVYAEFAAALPGGTRVLLAGPSRPGDPPTQSRRLANDVVEALLPPGASDG